MKIQLQWLTVALLIGAHGSTAADDTLSLKRGVIVAGGGSASGAEFHVQGSLGQFDADALQPSSGGEYTLVGGFLAGLNPVQTLPPDEIIFANSFEAP